MKIAVLGAGAMGGILAWHLARAGHAPTIVGRAATVAALKAEGLSLAGAGPGEAVPVAAVTDPAAPGPQDLVLVGCKAQDWAAMLKLLAPLVGPETLVMPLLNGIPFWFFQGWGGRFAGRSLEAVDPGGRIAAAVPSGQILGAVLYLAAERLGPAAIRWNEVRRRVVIGPAVEGGLAAAKADEVAALLAGTGLRAERSPDIRAELWRKLIGNATYNPLSVVTEATMGRIGAVRGLHRIIELMMREVAAVGAAYGVCGAGDWQQRLAVPAEMVDFRTSTLQDFDAGRPLELAGIIGTVIELGGLAGVPVPVLETVGALAADRWVQRWGGR